jgi:BirA family biotin operon repressor/biotin-[acetyl-CoA-carboxylase] ligase
MMSLGSPRVHRRVTGSTNADARALALGGAPHGTLVTTAEQREGRGRGDRLWHAPAGSALLCSLLLRDAPPLLSLRAGVAVASAISGGSMLKWPNDVLLDQRKVSGILVESRPRDRWAVLGIGVNVAVALDDLPSELRATAGTLGLARSDIEPLLARLLDALEDWLEAPPDELLDAWRARDALRGRSVSWDGGEGLAQGVDQQGRLLVRSAGATHALDAGEVHLRQPN